MEAVEPSSKDASNPAMTMPNPKIAPAEHDTDPRAADPASALLTGLLRRQLGLGVPPIGNLTQVEWSRFGDLLAVHRLGGYLAPTVSLERDRIPPEVQRTVLRFRDVTTRFNSANLMTMRRVLPRLDAAGVQTLVFKGPVIQWMAHADLFLRPSSDVDLLVGYDDLRRAHDVLTDLGYELSAVCRSLWWKIGLGEQHFAGPDRSAVTVDLHHRVQQPGCPLPRRMDRLFDHGTTVTIGGQAIQTLSPVHSALLAAMSFVKALHHREPAARYLIDLVALVRHPAHMSWSDLVQEARCQGLANTLALAVRAVTVLIGPDVLPGTAGGPVLGTVSDDTLLRMTLTPDDPTIAWPRRRHLLFALQDRKSGYPVGLAAMVGSDLLRRMASPIADTGRPTAISS